VRASRSKRARRAASEDRAAGSTLTERRGRGVRRGAPDFAHAAGAERGDDLVGAEAGAGGESHSEPSRPSFRISASHRGSPCRFLSSTLDFSMLSPASRCS
jgi:hypothetical protein